MSWRHLLLRFVVIAQGWIWLLVVVAPWILAADRLPDPVAANWGLGGMPDGSLPLMVLFALLFVTAACSAAAATALVVRDDLIGPSRGTGVGVLSGIGAFVACLSSAILLANLDAPRGSDATAFGFVAVLGLFGAPLLVAGAVRSLEGTLDEAQQQDRGRALEAETPGTASPAPVSDAPESAPGDEEAMSAPTSPSTLWQGTVVAGWLWLAIVVPVVVGWLVTLAVGLPGALVSAGFSAMLVGVGLTFTSASVTVDERAVVARLGPFGWPTLSVPIREIEQARVEDLRPTGWRGWGYRGSLRLFGRAALVVRAGDALVLDLRGSRRLEVTVDDAQGALSALESLLPAGGAGSPDSSGSPEGLEDSVGSERETTAVTATAAAGVEAPESGTAEVPSGGGELTPGDRPGNPEGAGPANA